MLPDTQGVEKLLPDEADGKVTSSVVAIQVGGAVAEVISTPFDSQAARLNVDKNEVIRRALKAYFKAQGKTIEFKPDHGGSRQRMNEEQEVQRVLGRVRALDLPEPEIEFKHRFKTHDLAWPDRHIGVEVSQRKRPADTNGWTVAWIRPGMGNAEIDQVLRGLLL